MGGYSQDFGSKNDEASDRMIKVVINGDGSLSAEEKCLKSGPIAQASLLSTPSDNVFIVAGGIQERWALLSDCIAPSAPCALHAVSRCVLASDPAKNSSDTVKWIGCDGPCQRWFHSLCLHFSNEDYNGAIKRKKWYCNRSDSN